MQKGLQVVVDGTLDLISTNVKALLKHSRLNGAKHTTRFDAILQVAMATPSDILQCVHRALAKIPKNKSIPIRVYIRKTSLVSVAILGINSFSQHWELCIVIDEQCLRFASQGITCTLMSICNGAIHKTPGKHLIDVTSEPVEAMTFEDLQLIGSSNTSINRLIAQLILAAEGEYNLVKNNCQNFARNLAGSILPTLPRQMTQIECLRGSTISQNDAKRRVDRPSGDTVQQKNAKRQKHGPVLRNATIVCRI